jgi:hypothetical protein
VSKLSEDCKILSRWRYFGELGLEVLGHGGLVGCRVKENNAHAPGKVLISIRKMVSVLKNNKEAINLVKLSS